MDTTEIASLLGETELFCELPEPVRLRVARRAVRRHYPRGDIVFHQGDRGDCLFVVAKGLLKIFVTSPDGAEMVLATLRRPHTLGELAVIDEGPRSASARAIEPTVLVALPREAFVEIITEQPAVAEALHRSLGALMRRVLEQASDLIFLDLPGRVAKLLIKLADDTGERTEEGTMLDLQVSQTTLAEMVGGSRPSVNQILRAFDARGHLELRGRKILIRRPDQLRRRAGL